MNMYGDPVVTKMASAPTSTKDAELDWLLYLASSVLGKSKRGDTMSARESFEATREKFSG